MPAVSPRDLYGRPRIARPPEERLVSRRGLLRLRPSRPVAADLAPATRWCRAGWDRDGHGPLLRQLEPAAQVLVDLLGLGARPDRPRLLDVGAGDGNLARAAAREGARVEACDISPRMVERGRASMVAAGLDVDWRVADAQALPYPDGAFDVVASSFGATLAPEPMVTARELVRVTRPGGILALTAWVPRGLPGRLDELVLPYTPLPDGAAGPHRWGVERIIRGRLGPLLRELELRSRSLPLRFTSAAQAFATLTRPFPLDETELLALRPDFDRLLASCNNRPPAVEIDARYICLLGRTASGHTGSRGHPESM
jgi:SAM-dependent methyltransferase